MKTYNKHSDNNKTALIILAAGRSERMGKIKQLLPWKKTTLLGNIIEQAKASEANDIYVVLGYKNKLIEDSIKYYNVSVIYNDRWEKGMGTSVSKAISFISKQNSYKAVIFTVADQPLITYKDLNKLIFSFNNSEKGIVSAQSNKISGVPAMFDRSYFNELIELNENYGARYIIKKYESDDLSINLSDHYMDIDTPDDYKYLKSLLDTKTEGK